MEKAVAIGFSILMNHPFVDGNISEIAIAVSKLTRCLGELQKLSWVGTRSEAIAMVQALSKPSPKVLTLEQFLELPETKPASEYIAGEIIQKPMPQGEHSTLQGDLVTVVNGVLKPDKVGRAYPELRCTFGGRSVVPDVSVFRWERIPRRADGRVANRFDIYPDWTIEILSPEQRQTKVVRNILHCLDHGTEMGWLLEPEESWIFIYGADRSVRVLDDEDAVLPVPGFAEAVRLTVGEVFGWLKN